MIGLSARERRGHSALSKIVGASTALATERSTRTDDVIPLPEPEKTLR
jgi:hypothetical protein